MNQRNFEGQKFALLVGVSECASGFRPLRCPHNSVAALYGVLTNPDIGDFSPDRVKSLTNPTVSEMQRAIGELFSRCSFRDLVLFYFTGHGVTDEEGDFFFTTRETSKFEDSSLNGGTAVSASFVRKQMQKCKSRRQIAILDCCFSGAFPDGVTAMDDQTINLERELGGEGRAILTAAASTQYALEQEGEELSVYTRYLIKGLGGEAVPAGQELIRVGNLADYIRDQLKTAAPAMAPQIYSAREGRNIVLARALVNNELRYLQLVQEQLEPDGTISDIGQRILDDSARQWGLSPSQVDRIIQEVTQPYQERNTNLTRYKDALKAVLDAPQPASERTWQQLSYYQKHTLNLRDEDVVPILKEYSLPLPSQTTNEEAINAENNQVCAESSNLDNSSQAIINGEVNLSDSEVLSHSSTISTVIQNEAPGEQSLTKDQTEDSGSQQNSRKIWKLVSFFAVLSVVIAGAYTLIQWSPLNSFTDLLTTQPKVPGLSTSPTLEPVQNLISVGDNENLYGSRSSSPQFIGLVEYRNALRSGITQFKAKNYSGSLETFNSILSDRGNEASAPRKDPEILIFRNNAQARLNHKEGEPIYTIAAAVPLSDATGEPFNIGQQILFGIAQAQTDAINREINLEVIIANDRNVPAQAEKLAEELIQPSITGSDNIQREILAVVGHYSSTVTCAALPVYNRAGLAVVSPASTKTDLRSSPCNGGQVFFRTTSSSAVEAQALIGYLTNRSSINNPKIAIFYKKGEGFSQDLTDVFVKTVANRVQASLFDLSDLADFNRGKNQLDGFNVLAIFPDGRTSDATAFDRAIELLKKSGNQLILGSNPLYDAEVSENPSLVKADQLHKLRVQPDDPGKGLVVAIDWFPGCGSNPDFVRAAKDLWGGDPTRVYATSYEAIQIITDRVDREKINTRAGMLNALGNSQDKVNSNVFQNKTISFNQNGDRNEIIDRILITPRSSKGFEPVEGYCLP